MQRVFSEYEVKKIGFKFKGTEAYKSAECIGSCEEGLDAKVIVKKCRGVIKKKRVKGAGTGVLKISLHIPYDIYTEMFGMDLDSLIEGVKGYGLNSIHPDFGMVALVEDEDGVEKYKAYPNCVIEVGPSRKTENGAEEVAEVELEVALSPDDFGQCMYEAIAEEIDETAAETWMTAFTPELVQKPA